MTPRYQARNRDLKWSPAQIHVRFTNGAHLADCIEFLAGTGQLDEFWAKIGYLTMLFRMDAVGRVGGQFGPPDEPPDEAVPPRNVNIWLSPDSPTRPSFVWRAETMPDKPGAKEITLLHGGLIYRDAEGWTVHT